MTDPKIVSKFDELKWRGLIFDQSDPQLAAKLSAGDGCYIGFDPTAKSLHIGNLAAMLVAARLAQVGIVPMILFGGATGFIGDPSGRSSERVLLDKETLAANVAAFTNQAQTILDRLNVKAHYFNNYDWTSELTLIEFLRDIGKHFTVNYMLAKEVVSTRLEGSGISFTEFSYMLLQSRDFLHLYQHHNCKVQFGASDQWGNITAGLELIRRKVQGDAYGFCIPLILDSQGKKFGKSVDGAIWLDRTMLSPYKFHQYFLNTADADVIRLLKVFTLLSPEEISVLEGEVAAAPEKRVAQNRLADEVCTIVHGKEATQDARRSAQVLFTGSIDGLSEAALLEIFADVPSSTLSRTRIGELTPIDIFAETKLASSKSEARRLIQSGGAYIQGARVGDGSIRIAPPDGQLLLLRAGKKSYHLVRIVT